MAKLIVVNPKPAIKPGVLAILIGAVFVIIVISGMLDKANPAPPFYLKIIMLLAGIVAVLLGFWRLTHDSKLYKNVIKLHEKIKVEGDKIVFPREIELKPGILECVYQVYPDGVSYHYTFDETGDKVRVKELNFKDFRGDVSVLAGFDSIRTVPNVLTASAKLEWIKLPAYEIVDKEYKVFGHSIFLAVLPPVEQHFTVSKSALFVSDGKSAGQAEIKAKNCLEGTISFQKHPKSKSRGVRLEFIFRTSVASYKSVITSLGETGSSCFKLKTAPDEATYILASGLFLSVRKIAEKIGITPIIAGEAWKSGKAKIKLVLDLPKAIDTTDEADIFVEVWQ
jgi:hypothetical protein